MQPAEVRGLLSPRLQNIVDILMILKKTHTGLLEIFDDAINEIKRGVYVKNGRRN